MAVHGLSLSSETKTVGSGKDFSTIQAAIDYFANKFIDGGIIDVDAGTYSEALDVSKIRGPLLIRGDQRSHAGLAFVHNTNPVTTNYANSGVGTITLSNSGNDITVARASTNPDMATNGVVNGDKYRTVNDSGALSEYTVSSVSGNVITLTGTAPTIGDIGSAISLEPNRIINVAQSIQNPQSARVTLQGFKFNAGLTFGSQFAYLGNIKFDNCLFDGTTSLKQVRSGVVFCDLATTMASGGWSFVWGGYGQMRSTFMVSSSYRFTDVEYRGVLHLEDAIFCRGTTNALYALYGGKIYAEGVKLLKQNNTPVYLVHDGKVLLKDCQVIRDSGSVLYTAMYIANGARMVMDNTDVQYWNLAVQALDGARVHIQDTGGISGNNTDFSPTVGSLGSNGALITTKF